MFNKTNIILCSIITVLLFFCYMLYNKIENLQEDISISKANEKAFIQECSNLKEDNRVFQFTIDQLSYYNDSLISKIKEVQKELSIKDKELKQAQIIKEEIIKVDTIVFKDTIFYSKDFHLDTLIRDDWYSLSLNLKYPSNVIIKPYFYSEKYIITHYNKETINPPKKFFIARWFQKRHKVLKVDIVEKNPYINIKQQRFIEIIK